MHPGSRVLLLASVASACHAQTLPAISGFVTQPGTTAYQVNGTGIVCNPVKTQQRIENRKPIVSTVGCPFHVLGDSVTVYGDRNKKAGLIEATRVETDMPIDLAVAGFALVDRVLSPLFNGTSTLRVDGYSLHLGPETKVTFAQGSNLSLGTVGTNVWVRYAGTLHPDGTVTAASLFFSPNVIRSGEDKLRSETDFNAADVKEEDRQSAASRLLLGRKAKQLPASRDKDMQKRVNTIGNKLVPAYQRDLPTSDPTRIDFRFQLVDDPKLHTTFSSPSGIIQVPESIPEILADDAQLAAILSAAVAEVLEKQDLRAAPGNHARTAAAFAGSAAGFFIPGAGLSTLAIGGAQAAAERHQQEQSTRTGLTFMHDAGFDLTQAPVAWWTLADTKQKGLAATRLPYRTQYLYGILSTAWRTTTSPQ